MKLIRNFKNLFSKSEAVPTEPATPLTYKQELKSMFGRIAEARTKLRLTGYIEVDGKQWEAISKSSFVHKGKKVKIIGERFGRLLVIPLDK